MTRACASAPNRVAWVWSLIVCTIALPPRVGVAAPPPPTATLEGRAFERAADGSRHPVAFVNVVVVGTRRGTLSDEAGRFRLVGVPVGALRVKVMQAGLAPLDTLLTFVAGSVTPLEAELRVAFEPPDAMRPEAPTPSRALRARWRDARVVRAYRLDRVLDASVDSSNAIGGARITAALARDAVWSSRLRAAFADSRSWSRMGPAAVNMGELYGLRFHDGHGWIDVVVATRSDWVSVHENGGPGRAFSWNTGRGPLRRLFE